MRAVRPLSCPIRKSGAKANLAEITEYRGILCSRRSKIHPVVRYLSEITEKMDQMHLRLVGAGESRFCFLRGKAARAGRYDHRPVLSDRL